METINNIRALLDEMPILGEISKDFPFPYNAVINQKIKEFNTYLVEIHTIETEKHNEDLQELASNILKEMESQQFEQSENVVRENFFGKTIETKTFNSK